MHRIVGLYVSEQRHSGVYQIGVALEKGQRGVLLSHYMDQSADCYSGTSGSERDYTLSAYHIFTVDDPLPVLLERIRIAMQLCKAILFLSRISPPFLLGSHIEVNNIVVR